MTDSGADSALIVPEVAPVMGVGLALPVEAVRVVTLFHQV
jgi:hypothetical protein